MRASRDEKDEIARAIRDAGGKRAECPLCVRTRGKPDRKRSLASFRDGGFHCFRCGVHGRLHGVEFEPSEGDAVRRFDPPDGYHPLAYDTSHTFASARQYLYGRCPAAAVNADLQIGACADGFYAGRIIVPVLDDIGGWQGFVARDWTGRSVRPYLYPKGMKRDALLYNLPTARMECGDGFPMIVVEGVFDALALWPWAVACLGKPTHGQLDILLALDAPVCFVLDGDAHEEAWALAQKFRFESRKAGYVKLPPGTDPDEVDRGELVDAVRASVEAPL